MPSDDLVCLYCLCPIRLVSRPARADLEGASPYHEELEPRTTLWPESHYKDIYKDDLGWYSSCPSAGLGARGEVQHYRYSYRLLEEILNGHRDLYYSD